MLSGERSRTGPIETEPLADLGVLVTTLRERLRPLIICLSRSWGGLEHIAAADSTDLAELGFPVQLLCLEKSPIHEFLGPRKRVDLIPITYQPRDYFDFKLRSDLIRLTHDGVNLIHLHQPSLLGSVTPWFWGKKDLAIVATRHILNAHNKRNPFHALIYSRLDALIVISKAVRKNVMMTHPLRERQIKVIHHGLDFEQYSPEKVDAKKQRNAWAVSDDTIVIGLVGRIDPGKGQATFIQAAAGLVKSKKPGERFKFVIVGEETLGSTSEYLAVLREMVSQFHLEDDVIFAGYQENIPEVMRAFDILVMPSRLEAFGLVAIEAMAMERPIVISRGGSANEIVGKEQEYGLLVRPDDAFDLQQRLRFLVDEPSVRLRMGQLARQYVVQNYDRQIRSRRTLDLYHRIMLSKGL